MKMTAFTKKVYSVVAKIPLGQVRSYKWVAQKAGFPAAYRAVGTVLKKNPYLLIIPCHRVVKSDLSLGGYAGGEKNKKILIKLEKEIAKCLTTRK
ncbi:MAG: MGMT family protein [Candidatus Omnitrophota bacterium]|jgi:O-6-methylguanine DNA methyltransferase